MLALFRNNQFTTAIPLALYVLLTHVSAFFIPEAPPPDGANPIEPVIQTVVQGGVLYRMWFEWLEKMPLLSALTAAALVYLQALLVNRLADEFRILHDRSWLPGLFYALAAVSHPDFLVLSPPLVAATFIPTVLRRIFRAYNQPKATALVFDAAFWATVASLFYPPAFWLLLSVYLGLSLIRSYTFREQVVSFCGIVTALFLAWLWYFWTDRGGEFWHVQFDDIAGLYRFPNFDLQPASVLGWSALLLFAAVVVLSYGTYMFRKLIQTQKYVSVLYWFWLVAGLTFLFQSDPRPAHFMLLAAPTGIFLSLSFTAFRKRAMAEILHLALLGFILFVHFFTTGVGK